MIIYKITNLINNKIYVGQTINSLEHRWSQHCRNNRNSAITNAIGKYGEENFKKEIILECSSIDELNINEEMLIKQLNSLVPNGYNIEYGGNNFKRVVGAMTGKKHSEETKRKMSQSALGKPKSEQAKINMSLANRGRKISQETIQKIRVARTGKSKVGNKVFCKETNKIYKSVTEASKELNIPRRSLCRFLNNHGNSKITLNIVYYKE